MQRLILPERPNWQAEAERLANEYIQAQIDYETAVDKADSLQAQADAESARATQTAQKLGRLAAQQYRNGGDNAALDLFFSGSAASADDLLACVLKRFQRKGEKIVDLNRRAFAAGRAAVGTAEAATA